MLAIARRTMTFAAAALTEAAAIKQAIASAATEQTYTGGALDGAKLTPLLFTGFAEIGAIPQIKLSSSAGSYVNNSTVVFTGPWNGATVTRTATIVGTDGNATFYADGPLDGAPTKIVVAAQANTSGQFEFGWGGVAPAYSGSRVRTWWIRCGAVAGNIKVRYALGEDTIAATVGGEYAAAVAAVLGSTAVGLTILEL